MQLAYGYGTTPNLSRGPNMTSRKKLNFIKKT